MRGQTERALVEYQEALKINPNLAPAQAGLRAAMQKLRQ
jgi:hypothetical protein